MGSVNRVILVGNLGKDAELKYTPGGTAIAKFSMATTETWNDKQGQKQERTEWHNVDLWGKTAEVLSQYLTKGKQVYIEGRLQTDEYTDRDGIKRRATKVRCDRVVLLGGGRDGGQQRSGRQAAATQDDDQGFGGPVHDDDTPPVINEEDIPF